MAQFEILSKSIPVSMHEDWFDIATTDHFWMQWRFEVFKKIIKNKYPLGQNLLEIGCGPGTFREQIENYYKIPVDGCDLNVNALKAAKQGLGRVMQYNIFDKNPNLIGNYDSIFLMDVIEHLDDDVTFLKTAAKHGKPGSLVFINVPAGMYLYSKYDIQVGHIKRYDKATLKQTIKSSGLEPLEIVYWAGLLIPIGILRKLTLTFSTDANTIKNGFKPPGEIANQFLKILKKFEIVLPINTPLGASLIAIARVKT